MEAAHSSEISVITGATRRHIAEDGVVHSHCRENLKPTKETAWKVVNTGRLMHCKMILSSC
jgi:hypothetical protein